MKRLIILLAIMLLCVASSVAASNSIIQNSEVESSITLLETWIEAQMDYRGIPGLSIGIVYDQDLIWAKGFGYSDVETKTASTPQTIYGIASVTKVFTSTAIMQLRDQGKLSLDDPIVKYLPWFKINQQYPETPPITIRHLITHTSGLPREAAFPYWTNHEFPTLEQIKNTLPNQQTIYPTETEYKYSNLGMALLGEIVVAASKESYVDYIQKHILDPLGMSSTFVFLPDKDKKRFATSYGRRLDDGTRKPYTLTETNGLAPAANLKSTVEDLARFVSLQFRDGKVGGNQILLGSTLREMQRVHWLQSGWHSGRGLGFGVWKQGERTIVGHSGWIFGYRTQMSLCPAEKVAVIVLTNAEDGVPGFFAKRAFELVAPAIQNAVAVEKEPQKFDSSWNQYVGDYHDPWDWDYKIMILNDRLVLYGYEYPPEDNPEHVITKLTPVTEHTFRMGEEHGELLIFEFGKDGKINRVKTGENYIYPTHQK